MKDKSQLPNCELIQILKDANWNLLREKVMQDREIVRYLMRRAYVKDGLLFWRAVEGIGVAAEAIDAHKPGYAAEMVRRYLWLVNDESGGRPGTHRKLSAALWLIVPSSAVISTGN